MTVAPLGIIAMASSAEMAFMAGSQSLACLAACDPIKRQL
jgi:hypothetical protein